MTLALDRYNYRTFALSEVPRPEAFEGPAVGDAFIDFQATTLDGRTVHLSDYIGRTVVLETGSLTCPIYTDTVDAMNALPPRFPDVTFLMLYTHEAHPGERIGPHHTMDDKRAAARTNCTVNGELRQILVDDLAGTAHRAYGGFPNMLYLIDAEGTVRMRGHWSDPIGLERALERLRRAEPLSGLTFRFRYPNPFRALRTLLRGGWKAVFDGTVAVPWFPSWHRRERDHGWG